MKRAEDSAFTSFGRERVLRLRRREAELLFAHMRQNPGLEQMAFGLCHRAETAQGMVFLVNEVIRPHASDLRQQSVGGVTPERGYFGYVYFRAFQTGQDIVEFHTHPGDSVPKFSPIDEAYAYPNVNAIAEKLPAPVTFVMLVGNNRFDAFDGLVWDRELESFHSLSRIEVLGRPTEIYTVGERCPRTIRGDSSLYDRQTRIPGWNQSGLARQRIGIVGLGGNGAHVFQTLLGMGAAAEGFFALVDADEVEASNIPRIPYATLQNVGSPKVTVAAQWAGSRNPAIPIYSFPCSIVERVAQERLGACTVLFGCVDNDGGRMVLNELAVRYGIPFIDLGCDVIVEDEAVTVGGQVRVVLPGESACLVCCRGFDPNQAAIDLMDNRQRAQHAARGYVRNAESDTAPSIANLNGLAAHTAIAQFLAMVNGKQFGSWDYCHFDQSTLTTITASTAINDDCPCCGQDGYLGKGDYNRNGESGTELLLTHVHPDIAGEDQLAVGQLCEAE